MSIFKGRIYTGPCWVKDMADNLRTAGITVTCEGTEHVYFEVEAEDKSEVNKTITDKLLATFNRSFDMQPTLF